MSAGRNTDWTLAHVRIVNAEERREVYRRSDTRHRQAQTGKPVGYVERMFDATGAPLGWDGYIYTDSNRRNQGAERVGGRHNGGRAHERAAAEVWEARILQGLEVAHKVEFAKSSYTRARSYKRVGA